MKRYIRNTNYNNQDAIFAMANIRGKHVKVPGRLDFSFFFSPKDVTEGKEIAHGLRVKPIFNPEKMSLDMAGTLKLHGDWEYIPGTNDKKVAAKDVRRMKAFFSKNIKLCLLLYGKKHCHRTPYMTISVEQLPLKKCLRTLTSMMSLRKR